MKWINVVDRRTEKRIPVDQRAWCEGHDVTLYGRITNASLRGAFIRTAASLNIGDAARLVWNTPSGDRTVIKAEVIWVSDGGSGTEPGLGLRIIHFERGEDTWTALLQESESSPTEN